VCSGALVFDYQGKNKHMHTTQAATDCKQQTFGFQELGSRRVEVDFSGGHLSSDGGALLLREMDASMRLCEETRRLLHRLSRPGLRRARVAGAAAPARPRLALGYEDLIDHERLRVDPLLAAMCGRADVLGLERIQAQDQGKPLAGKSTLNRLELGAQEITCAPKKSRRIREDRGALARARRGGDSAQERDHRAGFRCTDDPLHGHQEGRFYHGYYGGYSYLPLYCFCGDLPLWAQLRTADRDGAEGTLEALKKIVAAIRQRFGKRVRILVRGDSDFAGMSS